MHFRYFARYAAAALACSAGALSTQDTLAGQKTTATVVIVPEAPPNAGNALGSIGSARNSADTTQTISCSSAYDGTVNYGSCSATNAAGAVLSCFTTDPTLLRIIRSISSQSNILFYSSGGNCTIVEVGNSSVNAVPLP